MGLTPEESQLVFGHAASWAAELGTRVPIANEEQAYAEYRAQQLGE